MPTGPVALFLVAVVAIPEILRHCKPLAKSLGDLLVKAGNEINRLADAEEATTPAPPAEAPVAEAPAATDPAPTQNSVEEPSVSEAIITEPIADPVDPSSSAAETAPVEAEPLAEDAEITQSPIGEPSEPNPHPEG
jgi:protein TonB